MIKSKKKRIFHGIIYNSYWPIGLLVRMFPNGPVDQGSIPDRVILKTQKWHVIHACLTLSIIRYGSSISGAIRGKEQQLPLFLNVVTIENEACGSPASTVSQHDYKIY